MSRRTIHAFATLVLGALLLTTVACRRPKPVVPDTVDAGPGNKPWYAGTPEMQASIRELLAQVPVTTGAGRIELGRRIVAYGEPAVPILVEGLRDPRQDTRGTAAWLLGFLQDSRSTTHLARATRDPVALVRYEAATALTRMGDPRGIRALIEGLEDDDPRVRGQCVTILEKYTGKGFGYKVDDSPEERAAAVARWRAWATGASRGTR